MPPEAVLVGVTTKNPWLLAQTPFTVYSFPSLSTTFSCSIWKFGGKTKVVNQTWIEWWGVFFLPQWKTHNHLFQSRWQAAKRDMPNTEMAQHVLQGTLNYSLQVLLVVNWKPFCWAQIIANHFVELRSLLFWIAGESYVLVLTVVGHLESLLWDRQLYK